MVHLTLRDLRALRAGKGMPVEKNGEPVNAKHRNGQGSKGNKQRKEPAIPLASLRAVREGLQTSD